jgi:hypothetical protein
MKRPALGLLAAVVPSSLLSLCKPLPLLSLGHSLILYHPGRPALVHFGEPSPRLSRTCTRPRSAASVARPHLPPRAHACRARHACSPAHRRGPAACSAHAVVLSLGATGGVVSTSDAALPAHHPPGMSCCTCLPAWSTCCSLDRTCRPVAGVAGHCRGDGYNLVAVLADELVLNRPASLCSM